MSINEALDRIMKDGAEQLKMEGIEKHLEALGKALFDVTMQPECEVRLTYKNVEQATAAWTWMIWATKRMDLFDAEKSFAFGIELNNGSGLRFFMEPEAPASG